MRRGIGLEIVADALGGTHAALTTIPEHPMKTKLLIITLLATLLGGCIVVPAHSYAYRPAARVYVY
ncbi:hypothetical protein ASG35_01375 [Burkholderia sp. Leaf177]|nr:hypothetical protein ASG35_01375 [Burkholderia sp. Leaf177]